ncbi:hypothetical protein [Rossellomorea sp. LjRoot5]|uniref:hypothetical protein n=1 Tax=Rossellomorea sp. LjRoot5 TaxID=3342331 RepID=UPI003ECFF12B
MNHLADVYKDVIYKLLLTSNGRTTDILEVLAGEDLELKVENQTAGQVNADNGRLTPYIYRESHIITKDSKFILSHNFAKIYPEFIPNELGNKVSGKTEGIGKSIKNMDIISTRRILEYGWKYCPEIVDLHGNTSHLIFEVSEKVPFKEYEISFEQNGRPGIHLLEYFNPAILNNIALPSEPKVELFVK